MREAGGGQVRDGGPGAPPARGDRPVVRGKRLSLRAYVVGIMALFAVTVAVLAAIGRNAAINEARDEARADARFGAELAARSIADGIEVVRATVARTAATPGIAQVFAGPSDCSLLTGGAGPFTSAHLDLVAADGRVACTSRRDATAAAAAGYGDALWLPAALAGPGVQGPVTDARSGRPVIVVSAPVNGGEGAVVAFLDLDALGPGLAASYGGPRGLEFVVTTGDTVVSRSLDAGRWAGAPLAGTGFDPAAEGERADLDGRTRLYGRAAVPDLGWTVHAGADREAALATTDRQARRTQVVATVALLLVAGAAVVLYRRVARPVRRLAAAVRTATSRTALSQPAAPVVEVTGPREIAELAEDLHTLVATSDRELATAARLATIVESSRDAFVSATLDGVVTTWNPAAERLYGYRADEIVGRPVSVFVSPEHRHELDDALRRVAAGEHVPSFETERVRADGVLIPVSQSYTPMSGPDGSVVGFAAVARDLSATRRAEAERAALERRLSQSERLESLGKLAGGIAHDFNNLLAVIINYSQLAAEQLPEGALVRADIEEVRAAGERGARLTRQLLQFGKRADGVAEPLDVDGVVADVHDLLARSIGEHIDLDVRLGGGLPPVAFDRGQLEQILLNLAVNARDAMPGGGRLIVETSMAELDEQRRLLHPEAQPGPYVQIVVSDTGEGMSDEVRAHVFEPFFTTKKPGEGTGLGLSTVYGIVTKAGGTIDIYSEVGLGTTVRVLLPLADSEVREAAGGGYAEAPRGDGETILVVEDEPAVMELTSRLLSRNGYEVIAATNSTEAHDIAVADPRVRLLLTDSVMPQMSGPALAERVHAIRPDLPVLFMSGYGRGVLGGPLPAGEENADLIEKPFTEHTLLSRVAAALAGEAPPGRPPRRSPT